MADVFLKVWVVSEKVGSGERDIAVYANLHEMYKNTSKYIQVRGVEMTVEHYLSLRRQLGQSEETP